MRGPKLWERLRRVDPLIWDALLAAALLLMSILGVVFGSNGSPDPGGRALDRGSLGVEVYVLLVLGCVPLVFRRRRPGVVLTVVGAASVALGLGGRPDLVVALAVASFTAAAHVERERFQRRMAPIALASAVASFTLAYASSNWVEVLVSTTFTVGLPMIFGRVGFNRRRRITRDRERAAHDAVSAERARIARELHDVVAHAMSVMVVQAGAARAVVDHDAAAAKSAIARIEETGRDGMIEMRRLIGILKEEEASAAMAPQPGLDQLAALLDTVRHAGVPVEKVTRGEPRPVSPSLDLTAYRVVQEALTNVLKHAGPASARVVMDWGEDALEIEVADDGKGAPSEAASVLGSAESHTTAHGLIGMRERLAIYGGSLETGPRAGGGFVVRARLPLTGATSP